MGKIIVHKIKNSKRIPPQKLQNMTNIILEHVDTAIKNTKLVDPEYSIELIMNAETFYEKHYLTADIGIQKAGHVIYIGSKECLHCDAVMLIEDTLQDFAWIDGFLYSQVLPAEVLVERLAERLNSQPYKY